MRTEKQWTIKIYYKFLSLFSPRIQTVLKQNPIVEDWNPHSVYLHGNSGTGKTIMACRFMMSEIKRMFLKDLPGECLFISVPELFLIIKGDFQKESEIIDRYSNCAFLLLDDLGLGKPSDWALHILYLIINRRYEYARPTVITSNFDLAQLSKVLGDDRIVSRINQSYQLLKLTKKYDTHFEAI